MYARNKNSCITLAFLGYIRKAVKHHVLILNGKIQLKPFEIFVLIRKTPENEIHTKKSLKAELCYRVTMILFERKRVPIVTILYHNKPLLIIEV